jgi:phosphate-selective porin OprO/OprP
MAWAQRVARSSRVRPDLTDDDMIGGKEQNVTAGVNWYLTRYVRMMFNYVWVDAERRRDLQTERPQIVQFRMQFAI